MKALITGASSGIGRAIAIDLSQQGYDIIAVGRNQDTLNRLHQVIVTSLTTITMDLAIPDHCYQLYEQVKEEKIDILVNNAGFGIFGEFSSSSLEKELEMIALHIQSMHILMKLFLIDMKKRNQGYILNVGSLAGFMPGPCMSTYYATKSYIVNMTQAIQTELKKEGSGVYVSVLCPGPVDTNFHQIAGIQSGMKPLQSQKIAKYAIQKMYQGKVVIIPGMSAKLARIGARLLPSSILNAVTYHIQQKKIK